MPISSGARGHVGYGVDTSIRWFPEGGRKLYRPLSSKVNSYLQRYLYCHPEAKNRYFNKHYQDFPSKGLEPQPAQSNPHSSKETFRTVLTDGKPIQKNQQQSRGPRNGNNSTVPASDSASPTEVRTAKKCKSDASRSSLCSLL